MSAPQCLASSPDHEVLAAAWNLYASTKMRADCTGSSEDIRKAKSAWSVWLIELLPSEAERRAIPAPRFQRPTEVRGR